MNLEGLDEKQSICILLIKTNQDLQTEICRSIITSL